MSKLKTNHKVETLIWLTIVVVFFVFSFEFNQEIEIYKFGATGWPRVILGLLLLVTLGNFLHLYKKGSEAQQGRVGISDIEEEITYDGIGSIKKLIAILSSAAHIFMVAKTSRILFGDTCFHRSHNYAIR